MNLFFKLRQEAKDFSPWFKAAVAFLALVYLGFWFFTIHLSFIEKERGFEPVLPAASKDSHEYVLFAESLLSGNGLSMNGRIETLRTPGYPVFVALIKTVGRSYFAVTLIQIILVFASALIIRRIGILFSSTRVGEIAAILLLINPVTITLSLLILTDTLFLFLFVLGFYLAASMGRENKSGRNFLRVCVISALFISAIYVRGMGLFALPVFIAPFLAGGFHFKVKMKSIGIMLILIAVCVSPWMVRNYVRTGVISFNSFESVNMSWVIPKFLSVMNGTEEDAEALAFQRATGVPAEAWQDFGWHDIRYSKQISRVGRKIILEHPFSYLKFHIITSVPFLFPSSILFARDAYDGALQINRPFKYGSINALSRGDFGAFYRGIKEDWWKLVERLGWLAGLLLGLLSIWKKRRDPLASVFLFIPAYLMLLSGPAAGPRLSFQAWPFMFILFVSGGLYLVEILKNFFRKKKEIA